MGRWLWTWLLLGWLATATGLRVGLQSAYGGQAYVDPYAGFVEELGRRFGSPGVLVPLWSDDAAYDHLARGDLDVLIAGPSLCNCLEVADTGVQRVASLAFLVGNTSTPYLGGAVVARAESGIRDIAQLRGKRVALTLLSQLSGAQAQWGAMRARGLDLFLDTASVIFAQTQGKVLDLVVTGAADAGFMRGGDLESARAEGAVAEGEVVVVSPISETDYPSQVSAPLYPASSLLALPHVGPEDRARLAAALTDMTNERSEAMLAAGIAAWTTPYNYAAVVRLQHGLGILQGLPLGLPLGTQLGRPPPSVGACLRDKSVAAFVTCPRGTVARADPTAGCYCPPGTTCACDPCTPGPHGKRVLVVCLATLLPACAVGFAALACAVRRRSTVPLIPRHELCLSPPTGGREVGQSCLGRVLTGTCYGLEVAVRRLVPGDGLPEFDLPGGSPGGVRHTCAGTLGGSRGDREVIVAAHAASMLRHAGLLPLLGVARVRGETLLVTPLQSAGTLHDLLVNHTVEITPGRAAGVLRDVAEAVTFLHSRGIHGADLASHKLLLDGGLRVLVRTPLARARQRRFPWDAPEVDGGGHGPASDVFALGMLAYEVLYRRRAYQGEDTASLATSYRRPSFDPALERSRVHLLMARALSREPGARPLLPEVLWELRQEAARPPSSDDRRHALLNKMLPVQVAERLRNGLSVEPQRLECVTLFCGRVAGMDRVRAVLGEPAAGRIHRALTAAIDEAAYRHGLLILSTVENSYMAVSNVLAAQPDHAARVLRFARDAVRSLPPCDTVLLRLRCAVHSGPVTSAVLPGAQEPRYCLMGRTVAVACQLEATAEAGTVVVSAATAVALPSGHAHHGLSRHGRQRVRGHGCVDTFVLDVETPRTSEER